MCKKTITIMILTICVGISFAAENGGDDIAYELKKVGDNYVSVEEYWVIKSQALTELIPFLTRTRSEAKGHYKALTDYIKHIGKGRDFLDSGITGPSSPAEYARVTGKAEEFEKNNVKLPEKWMTWDQLAELAMEFVVNEGYAPTDVNGPEEIEMFKQICDRKEKYGKKVQTDFQKIAQSCMDMKAYLDSIDQFEAGVKYTRYLKEEKEKASAEDMKYRREQRAAVASSKRETKIERRESLKERRRERAFNDRMYAERRKRLSHTYYRGYYRY
jgi:hypothetical protein